MRIGGRGGAGSLGKTSKRFLTEIEARLLSAELNYVGYNSMRNQFERFTETSLELVTRQNRMLNEDHGGDLAAARQDPGYLALDTEVGKKDAIAQTQVARLNRFAASIADDLDRCQQALGSFERFVKAKDGGGKLPWKKRSVSSARTFIADASKTLAGTKRPTPVDVHGE